MWLNEEVAVGSYSRRFLFYGTAKFFARRHGEKYRGMQIQTQFIKCISRLLTPCIRAKQAALYFI